MTGQSVAIIGAGAMGTALAIAFDRAGSSVTLCGTQFDDDLLAKLAASRVHPVLDAYVPEGIVTVRNDAWAEVLPKADLVVLAIASVGVKSVVSKIASSLKKDAVWVVATKGWDPDSAEPLSSVGASSSSNAVVIMVGPSLASELAAGVPTALVCASSDASAAHRAAAAIDCASVRVYVTDDVAGVEVGAALKNVLAIGIGFCDGLAEVKGRSMTNTKAALFSRGLVEMGKLAEAMGGRATTVLGLAGAGDLFVTVLGGRNGRFGRLVGHGLAPEKAFAEMGTTVEGFENAREAKALASQHGLNLPVVEMVYSVLHNGAGVEEAISKIVLAPVEQEI
jgi:glycerol-3-phosphate dehydrogenase (NAD(P)+)